MNYFFQVSGAKSKSIGISSRRPASISKVSINFEGTEKNAKFAEGPTSARPGPTLFIAADTAVNFVTKSQLSKEIANTIADMASRNGANQRFNSPFSAEARRLGYSCIGGKLDDVTVIAAVVSE